MGGGLKKETVFICGELIIGECGWRGRAGVHCQDSVGGHGIADVRTYYQQNQQGAEESNSTDISVKFVVSMHRAV